ncbi:MAG: OmpA family protein [Flavobacteriales bacterium]|nr:OmpA family protein [Flavobacteriales bacterium]
MFIKRLQRLFIFVNFLLICTAVSATDKVVTTIEFEEHKTSLAIDHEEELRRIISTFDNRIIEKIDIINECGRHEYAKDRTEAIQLFLKDELNVEGLFQLMTSSFVVSTTNCVDVVFYLLEPNLPAPSGDPAVYFFPEEFGNTPIAVAKTNTPHAPYENIPEEPLDAVNFELKNVYFHGNSAVYKEKSQTTLDELLHFMLHSEARILLEGHVNGRMGKSYLKKVGTSNPERVAYKNAKDLSLARALSIKKFLVDNGVDPARIECVGKGGGERIYKNPKSSKQEAANRRIEIVIL